MLNLWHWYKSFFVLVTNRLSEDIETISNLICQTEASYAKL